MKYYLKVIENTGTEEEAESYLYSDEGIVTFSDKKTASAKAKVLTRFLNNNKNKKNGNSILIEGAKGNKKPNNHNISYRWVISSSFSKQ